MQLGWPFGNGLQGRSRHEAYVKGSWTRAFGFGVRDRASDIETSGIGASGMEPSGIVASGMEPSGIEASGSAPSGIEASRSLGSGHLAVVGSRHLAPGVPGLHPHPASHDKCSARFSPRNRLHETRNPSKKATDVALSSLASGFSSSSWPLWVRIESTSSWQEQTWDYSKLGWVSTNRDVETVEHNISLILQVGVEDQAELLEIVILSRLQIEQCLLNA